MSSVQEVAVSDAATVGSTAVLGVGEEFEGKAIVAVGVEIPGVAGGLRDAMKFGPVAFAEGEQFFLVLSGVCQKVRFEPDDKKDPGGDQVRVQILDAQEGVFVSEDVVRDALTRQRDLVEAGRRAEEEAKGISRLAFDDEESDLGMAHANGDHRDGLVDGCPVCALEVKAEADEQAATASITRLGGNAKQDGADG